MQYGQARLHCSAARSSNPCRWAPVSRASRSHGADELRPLVGRRVDEKAPRHERVEHGIATFDAGGRPEGVEQGLGLRVEHQARPEERMEERGLAVRAGTRTRKLDRTSEPGGGTGEADYTVFLTMLPN